VEHHGDETYFVIGEGLLGQSGQGREHLLASATAQAQLAPPFRFSRMGPSGVNRQLSDTIRKKLAAAMTTGPEAFSKVPSGFTYLGQFVDHDLTFDKTNVTFGQNVPPAQLLEARSPSLDLDSLYGAGPGDPGSAMFYEADGIHLKSGTTRAGGGFPAKAGFDLQRGAGSTAKAKRTAIIPDPRNDENLAVAQTHLAFIRFHNRVVDTLPNALPIAQRFAKARKRVTHHYQWMLRTDLLPRICRPSVVNDVFAHGRKIFEVSAVPTDVPTMPIEFSVAAYRLGHSMVREAYSWNKVFDEGGGTLQLLFTFTGLSGDLGGSLRLPSIWIADFRRLYDFGEAGRADLVVPKVSSNVAMRIDTKLSNPLRHVPGFPAGQDNLAFRNLTRARMVRLATGQQMAAFLRSRGVAVTTLTKAQIRDGNGGVTLDGLTGPQRDRVVKDTPLWFYVLREAEFNQGRLDGVGARIVAETFHRAMEGSATSIVREPGWRPSLGPDATTFRMVDLLLFAFQGKKSLLAPLG